MAGLKSHKRTKAADCWLLLVFYLSICRFSNICRHQLDLRMLITRATEQSGFPATVLLVTVSNPTEIRVFTLKWKKKGQGIYILLICVDFLHLTWMSKTWFAVLWKNCSFLYYPPYCLFFLYHKLQKKCFGCSFFWNICFCLFSCLTLFLWDYWVFYYLMLSFWEFFQFSNCSSDVSLMPKMDLMVWFEVTLQRLEKAILKSVL